MSKLEDEDGDVLPENLDEWYTLELQADELYNQNGTDYHNLWRTWKRNADGTYTYDVIRSEKECYRWLEENKELHDEVDWINLKKFWEEYPNGVIDFG